jgi:hypothetical protein
VVFGKLGIFLGRARHVYIGREGVGLVAFSGSRKWGDSMAMHQAQPVAHLLLQVFAVFRRHTPYSRERNKCMRSTEACANHSGSFSYQTYAHERILQS